LVFRAPEHHLRVGGHHARGVAYPATVVLQTTPESDPLTVERTFSHERVHLLQADQVFFGVGRPVQDAAARRVPVLRRLSRWVDLDVASAAFVGAAWLAGTEVFAQPWEVEASYLSGF
ncbi:MAG TPA: hypothetical protein VGB66_01970, partial [Longimicrobium sp.]